MEDEQYSRGERDRIEEIKAILERPKSMEFLDEFESAKRLGVLVKQHNAVRFAPVLNRHLTTMAQSTVEQKKAIGRFTNEILRSIDLTIEDQKLLRPAILLASSEPGVEHGRFRLKTCVADGIYRLSESHVQLWPLTLMPAPPRKEAFVDYHRNRSKPRGIE